MTGPDELREIAKALRQKDAYIYLNMTAGKVDAAADAWDADYNTLSGNIAVLAEEHRRLCKQLEAAEKEIADLEASRATRESYDIVDDLGGF